MRAQNSLKYKLLKLLICVTVIPTLIIGCAAYWFTSDSLLNAAMASTGQMNRHKADTFDQFAEELETILKDLTDSEATKAFLQLRGEPDTESYYLSAVRLSEKMDTLITQRGDAVDAVAFLWNDGSLPVTRSNGYRMPLEGDYRGNVFYQAMEQSDAAVHWIVLPETTDGLPGLFLYKTIYNAFADENLGVAVIHVNRAYICSILQTAEQAADSTMLMAADGKVIFQAGDILWREEYFPDSVQEMMNKMDTGSRTAELEGDSYLISVAESAWTGYKLVNVTSLTVIKENTGRILLSVMAAVFAALLLAVMFSLLLFRYLKPPIVDLHAAMTRFRKGHLEERITVRRKDELGELGISFNEMAERINRQIHEIEEEQKEKKEIAMRFLQAQISPHFLYNTLNSIKALTRRNRNEEACEMITSLISLLRIASGGSEEITLEQELRYVESYVLLMQKRRDTAIELCTELPSQIAACRVLKFTLQPFVENSIIHGNAGKPLCIRIHAERTEADTLLLTVRDSGDGFDTHILQERQRHTESQRFNRIGIHNVAERIRLYYGDNYGVSIQSEPGCGTCVTIRLPFESTAGE